MKRTSSCNFFLFLAHSCSAVESVIPVSRREQMQNAKCLQWGQPPRVPRYSAMLYCVESHCKDAELGVVTNNFGWESELQVAQVSNQTQIAGLDALLMHHPMHEQLSITQGNLHLHIASE